MEYTMLNGESTWKRLIRILLLLPTLFQLIPMTSFFNLLVLAFDSSSWAVSVASGASCGVLADAPPCVSEADSRAASAASAKPPSRPTSSNPVAATVIIFASL